MPTMTPEIYEEKRNGLIELLEGILKKATRLSDKSRLELEATVTKLKRNSFEIVLVGEFQGGKSTLFDTICDGRELSPRGIGIKTSACKISARSVPAEEPERVELHWKSNDELMLTMLDLVKDNLDDEERAFFTKSKKDGTAVLPSLEDARTRALVKKALEKEWKAYSSKPAAYDPNNSGRLDLLQISWLILGFCNDPALLELRKKTSVTTEELKTLVVFPKEWAERWLAGKETKWQLNEVPFAFLGEANIYIHSPNLERLGCIVVDCPGLFAGPWDTMVAQNAMTNADAILYLIGGERSLTDSDLKALAHIRKANQGHKVFFAINAKQSFENTEKNLRPVDVSLIKQRGFEIESNSDVDIFNALLAFNSRCVPDDQKLWRKQTSTAIQTYLQLDIFDDSDKIVSLVGDKDELYKKSGAVELLTKIETSVVQRKFKSILVTGGTEKAGSSLDALNGDLKAKEAAADKSLEAAEQEVDAARRQLNEFQRFATKEVDDVLGDEQAANLLADNYFQNVYLSKTEDIADAISSKIQASFSSSTKVLQIVWDLLLAKAKHFTGGTDAAERAACQKAESVLNEPVMEAVEEVATPATSGWIANIRERGNDLFETAYGRALNLVGDKVRVKWDSMFSGGVNLLEGLALDFDIELNPIDTPQGGDGPSGMTIQKEAVGFFIRKIAALIGAGIVAMVSAVLIGYILICIGLGGLPVIVVVIAGGIAGTAFWEWVNEKMLQGLAHRFRPEISSKLHHLFNDQKEKILQTAKNEIINKIVEELKGKFRASLSEQTAKFENRVKEMLKVAGKVAGEKKQVADEAKKIRETQIEPARQEIAEFTDNLAPYFQ